MTKGISYAYLRQGNTTTPDNDHFKSSRSPVSNKQTIHPPSVLVNLRPNFPKNTPIPNWTRKFHTARTFGSTQIICLIPGTSDRLLTSCLTSLYTSVGRARLAHVIRASLSSLLVSCMCLYGVWCADQFQSRALWSNAHAAWKFPVKLRARAHSHVILACGSWFWPIIGFLGRDAVDNNMQN